MKKTFLLLMMIVTVASVFGVQVGSAQAEGTISYSEAAYVEGKGIVFIFDASGFRNRDLREASIYVGSDFYDLFCWVTEDKEHIVCNAQGGLTQFAGQTGIIYLAGYIFYVEIPGAGGPRQDTPLVCSRGQVPGANYDVDFGSGLNGPYFVPGATLPDVENQASSWFGGNSYVRTSGLICDFEPK